MLILHFIHHQSVGELRCEAAQHNTNKKQTMKTLLTTAAAVVLVSGSASAATLVSYDYATTADPTAGSGASAWTATGVGSNAWAHGYDDASASGWTVTDGTSSALAYYQHSLSSGDAAELNSNDWTATFTVSVNGDAVNGSGGVVDNFYTADPARQNNNAMWVELAGGNLYQLTFENDASGNVFVNDGTTQHAIVGGLVRQNSNGDTGNFITYTLSSVSGATTLTDSLGGSRAIAAAGVGSSDRIIFGSYSSGGMGSTTWNSVSIDTVAVPEPSSTALLGLGGLALILRRRK